MNIDITATEYFEQLLLMEQQYGQEEDLYPWIYMLLQMTECIKRKNQGAEYMHVSIRDVHNAKRGTGKLVGLKKEIRKFIKKNAVPDFIVMGKEDENKDIYCYGCVEIKIYDSHYFSFDTEEKEEIIELDALKPIARSYRLTYYVSDEEIYETYIAEEDYLKLKRDDQEIIRNYVNEKYIKDGKISIPRREKKSGQPPKKSSVKSIPEYGEKIKKIMDPEIIDELRSHLNKCKKVLYTNGIQFCLLVLNENNMIKIKEIENFKVADIDMLDSRDIIEKAEKEWKKLLDGLLEIDWHSEPTVKISTDNKED